MTAPEDDLAAVLRRGISAAVSQVEPGADGLDKIRARTSARIPQPWLLAMLVAVLERMRYWTWRGHWSWSVPRARADAPQWLQTPPPATWLRTPRTSAWLRTPRTSAWLRTSGWPRLPLDAGSRRPLEAGSWRPLPVMVLRAFMVLAGTVTAVAIITLTVPPFRQALVTASSNMLSGTVPLATGEGTDVTGATAAGSPTPLGTGTQTSGSGLPAGAPTGPEANVLTSPSAATMVSCRPSSSGHADAQPSGGSATGQPAVPGAAGSTPTSSLVNSKTPTAAPSCPQPSPQPTPSPSASGGSPSPKPTTSGSTSPSPTPGNTSTSPAPTQPAPTPTDTTPTPTGSDSGTPDPTPSPSGTVPADLVSAAVSAGD